IPAFSFVADSMNPLRSHTTTISPLSLTAIAGKVAPELEIEAAEPQLPATDVDVVTTSISNQTAVTLPLASTPSRGEDESLEPGTAAEVPQLPPSAL
ncbi:MAG: hypothetical protein V4487_08555, partial [Chlamydiota bacterium]